MADAGRLPPSRLTRKQREALHELLHRELKAAVARGMNPDALRAAAAALPLAAADWTPRLGEDGEDGLDDPVDGKVVRKRR